jgi:hypothetical protein
MLSLKCVNFTPVSNKLGACSLLKQYGINFIRHEDKSDSPCNRCKEHWISGVPPTIETKNPMIEKIINPNSPIPISKPPTIEQATDLGKSLIQWAFNGFQNVPANEADLRLNICKENKCGMYDAESGRCNACGCVCSIKSKFSHEKCPADLWPQLGPEIMNNVPQGCRSCGS